MPSDEQPAERRPRLTPPIADVRRAVRAVLPVPRATGSVPVRVRAPPAPPLVLVALSGGADSLALAAATAFEAPRAGLRAGAVVVDHGLQEAPAEVAAAASDAARALGLDPVVVRRVEVTGEGGPRGIRSRCPLRRARRGRRRDRSGARAARPHPRRPGRDRAARARPRHRARRASPACPPARAATRRPLLGIRRATTRQACLDAGLEPWDDPHNVDPRSRACACASGCCPCSRPSSARASPRRSRAPPSSCREDDEAFTGQIDELIEEICEPAEAGHRGLGRARSRRTPPRCGSASSGTSSRASSASRCRARRRSRSRGSSPTGTARAHSTCPTASGRRARAGHVVFSTSGSTEVLPHDH